MKKLILSATALAACSLGAHAQGLIYFDTTSSANPVMLGGVADTTQDINAALMVSATGTAGSWSPVVELLLSSSATSGDGAPGFDSSDVLTAAGDVTFFHNGSLQDQSGNPYTISGIANGSTAFFEIQGWLGDKNSLAAAVAAGAANGTSAVFSEVLGGATSVPPPTLGGFTGVNLAPTTVVPEPSTLAMAGVGLASMLMFRRRNK